MPQNERVGGVEFDAEIDLQKFEKDLKKLSKNLESIGKATKSGEVSLSSYEKQLHNIGEAIKKAGQQFDNAGKKMSVFKKIGNDVADLFRSKLGTAAILYGIQRFVKSVLGASSALQELDSKARIVFGNTFNQVQRQVAAISSEVGRARSSLLQYAADMGAVIDASGIAGERLADMSTTLSKLAVDLASFHNATDVEAFNALRSAITGELEPLKRFGVVMTQANLQAFLWSKGIRENVADLNQAQLTALRYNYILDRTTTAQGDAARTAGSFANQSRKLSDSWKEFLEQLGQTGIIGVATAGVQFLGDMVSALALTVKAAADTFRDLWSVVSSVGGRLGVLLGFENFGVKDVAGPALKGKGNLGFEDFVRAQREKKQRANQLKSDIESLAGVGVTSSDGGGADKAAEEAKKAAEEIKKAEGEIEKARVDALKQRREVQKELLELKRETVGLTEKEARILERIGEETGAAFDIRRATNFKDLLGAMTRQTDDLAGEFDDVSKEVDRLASEIDDMAKESVNRIQDLNQEAAKLRDEFNAAFGKGGTERTGLARKIAEEIVKARETIDSLGGADNLHNLSGDDKEKMREAQKVFQEGQKFLDKGKDFNPEVLEFVKELDKLSNAKSVFERLQLEFEGEKELAEEKLAQKEKEIELSKELEKAFQEDRLEEFLEENDKMLSESQRRHAQELQSKQAALQTELDLQRQLQLDITNALVAQVNVRNEVLEGFKNNEIQRLEQIKLKALETISALGAAQRASASVGGPGFASGGRVFGPGGPTDDLVPAMLSNGEFVVRAAAVKMYGPLLDAMNSMRLEIPRYAAGGPVSNHTDNSRKVTLTQNFNGAAARPMSDPRLIRWHLRRAA